MKKILLILLALLTLVMGTAYADKNRFKDATYNFQKIHSIHLSSISNQLSPASNTNMPATDPGVKVEIALRNALLKRNVQLMSGEEAFGVIHQADVSVTIRKLGSGRWWKAPWDEEVTENEKTIAKDEHGHDVVVYIPVQRYIHHDGEWQYEAYADLDLTLKDMDTGKIVYTVQDNRVRGGTTDFEGMLGRICGDFAKDVAPEK